ncbi:MAG: replication initiation protein [Candidatus Babeliaceae bacterium]|nr:replication initiation protein [Candidatus Babeliaceae bacterium]
MIKVEGIKASWVIHISHTMSLVQQQLWNVLLAHAYDNLKVNGVYTIDTRTLSYYLGKNRSVDYLRSVVESLCIVESFNIINKTKHLLVRNKFKLLSKGVIEDGMCTYAFSNALMPQLINPRSYAKINLLMQAQFKSKYALVLYELCLDYFGFERTKAFTVAELKTYLGIGQHEYPEFKHFNYKIIKKAVAEVNKVSDISIAVNFDAKKGVDSLWFTIKKKMRTVIDAARVVQGVAQVPQEVEPCPFTQLKEHGVSDRKAKHIKSLFSAYEIQKVIDDVQRNIETVLNPAAVITKIFNSKEKQKIQPRFTGARKANEFDHEKAKLIHQHRVFIDNRLKELWQDMSKKDKQSLNNAFELWTLEQKFAVNFTGSRDFYHSLFLEQSLLLPHEKNFDEWALNQK